MSRGLTCQAVLSLVLMYMILALRALVVPARLTVSGVKYGRRSASSWFGSRSALLVVVLFQAALC